MNIWILRPNDKLRKSDNPWEPWYDKSFGFVVRANNENEARSIADENAGDENRGVFMGNKTANTNNPWLSSKYTTCTRLTQKGDKGVLMMDFASA